MPVQNIPKIAGVVLAGGKASRMNYCDKPLLPLQGKPLIEHVIERAAPQVTTLLISVNRNRQDYIYLDRPLIADAVHQYGGPLVGIYSAMHWLDGNMAQAGFSHLACFAADVPRFPGDLVNRLTLELVRSNSEVALALTGEQLQPLFSLWSLSTMPLLAAAIADGLCGPKLVLPRLATIAVQFGEGEPGDFRNINTTDELSELESRLAGA